MDLALTQDLDQGIKTILDAKYGEDEYTEFDRIEEERIDRDEVMEWGERTDGMEISEQWFEYDNESGFLGITSAYLSTLHVRDNNDDLIDSITFCLIQISGRGWVITEWK